MSVEAINWAFAQPVERSAAKFVLVAMARRCNDTNLVNGKWACWPSISAIVEDTGMNRKTVFDSLARLQESGFCHRCRRMSVQDTMLAGAAPFARLCITMQTNVLAIMICFSCDIAAVKADIFDERCG